MGNLSHFIAYRSVHKHLPCERNSEQLLSSLGTRGKHISSSTLHRCKITARHLSRQASPKRDPPHSSDPALSLAQGHCEDPHTLGLRSPSRGDLQGAPSPHFLIHLGKRSWFVPPKHKASAQLPSSTDTFWVVPLTSPYPHPGQDDQRRLPLLCQAHLSVKAGHNSTTQCQHQGSRFRCPEPARKEVLDITATRC